MTNETEARQGAAPAGVTLEQAEAALAVLRAEQAELYVRVRAAAEVVQALRAQHDLVTLTGRDPGEFWTDAALRAYVTDREWDRGSGNALMSQFINNAIASLCAEGFYEFDRDVSDDFTTCHRIVPRLALEYLQGMDDVHAALLTMLPALADDTGTMRVTILEHTCAAGGVSPELYVTSAEQATVTEGRRAARSGTLAEMLEYLASVHWLRGGPDDGDKYERW